MPLLGPVLRKLGLEERVAAVCQYKPGVSFTFGREYEIDFCFESVKGVLPTYASAGYWAPLMLIGLRLLQGLGAGAEQAGERQLLALAQR